MIELKTYAGSNVTPQNDAIMNNTNTLNNGIYYGCNVTIKDATTLHINAGQGIVYGRLFEVLDSDIPVSLSPSGTLLGQLYVHIDLSNIAAPIQILVDTGETLANLEDDPQLNIDSGITDMQLATFTVSTVGMSDLVETFKEVEPIRAVLGDADISAIGDGTVNGSIRAINTQLTITVDKPAGFNNKITFTKQGKHIVCDIDSWVTADGQTGQACPVEYRPSHTVYGVAYVVGSNVAIACRYYQGYIQFLNVGISNYVAGTVYGHLEWYLD